MKHAKSDLLQGTLDLLILRTLASGDMHGWGISQRLQQISQDVLQVNQGSLYPALYRLEQQGWIESSWGDSENNRRAKFYALTRSGRKQLAEETANWERITAAVARVPASTPVVSGFDRTGVACLLLTLFRRLRGSVRTVRVRAERWTRSCATISSSRPRRSSPAA